MSFIPEPNPDAPLAPFVRHAAKGAAAPDASAAISRTVRTDVPLPDDITEEQLRAHGLEVELRVMRDRVRHLEQVLRAAGRVLQPYLAGNGR
jgi:hypothetical protein